MDTIIIVSIVLVFVVIVVVLAAIVIYKKRSRTSSSYNRIPSAPPSTHEYSSPVNESITDNTYPEYPEYPDQSLQYTTLNSPPVNGYKIPNLQSKKNDNQYIKFMNLAYKPAAIFT